MGPKYQRGMGREDTAVAAYESNFTLWHLPPPCLPAHLHNCLGNRGHSPHIKGAELPASGVDRDRAAWSDPPVGDERSSLALFAETVVFERYQDRERIAVVKL